MSKAAAQTFISAAKATISNFESKTQKYYKDFIAGKEIPSEKDAKELADIIKEMKEVAKVYHGDVKAAMATFGGSSDTTIRNTEIMLQTILKKVKK